MRGDRIRRTLSRPQVLDALENLGHAGVNFDATRATEFTPSQGWHIDDYCRALPSEPPGEPVQGGSWDVACELARRYDFADPGIIRVAYRDEDPLEGRTMLLEGRFLWMRFVLGVRIGSVTDETRRVDGSDVRIWGWNYRTLEGHLEKGQMDYEVWKWMASGRVEFRIRAVSRAAQIRDPIVKLGFSLFGRHMQKKFVRRSLDRMDRLVRAELVAASTERRPSDAPDRSVGHLLKAGRTPGEPLM